MEIELEPAGVSGPAISQRETELEDKLAKRTMLLALFIALSVAELLIVIEMFRQTS